MRFCKRQAPVVVFALAAVFAGTQTALADPPSVASKQAEAQAVLDQVQGLDSNLEKAIENYNLATVQLGSIEGDLKQNTTNLGIARGNLRQAQTSLSRRMVAVYTSGDSNSMLEMVFGSSSLDEILSRIDNANTVSQQDTRIVHDVIRFRGEIKRREVRLQHARARQAEIVQERAGERASIQQQLAQRQAMLSSIRGEIAHLKAVEAARQVQLKRAAEARLIAQQQAAATLALQPVLPGAPAAATISTQTPSEIPAAPPSTYGGVVGIAMQYLGIPYRWGGSDPSGFDCSGFVMYVYNQVGVSLPHSSYSQYGYGTPVGYSDLQPGDLVFFDGLGHVGIYIGGGQFIHSPHTGDVVKISSMSGWYAATFVGARRL